MARRTKRLREVDLNLLPVLRSLLETNSVARTAVAMSLTPSAVSHTLARLRTTLGDELFVRGPGGLMPTRRATQLTEDLRVGLTTIERVLGDVAFDPKSATTTFRVATTDFGARLILPKMLASLDREARGVQISIRPMPADVEEALADDLDAMIGLYRGSSPAIYRRVLFSEDTAVLAREGHPRVKRGKLTLDDYLACSHIMIAPGGRAGSRIDSLLGEQGHTRRIATMVPNFLLGPYIVAETDLLLAAGTRLLQMSVGQLPVQVVPLPFELPPFDVYLLWHARVHADPAFAWFRDQLVAVHEDAYRKRGR